MTNNSRVDYDKLKKKYKRRRFFSLIVGLIFGLIIAFNIYYWLPLIQKKIDIPAIPQAVIATSSSEKTKQSSSTIDSSMTNKQETETTTSTSYEPRLNTKNTQISAFYKPLSESIDNQLTEANISGTFLGVKNNQIVLYKSYGEAAKQQANPLESSYMIASLQKSVTAVLIMSLIQENKLKLDTPLSEFYPDIPSSNQITIDSMLSMTSGLELDDDNRPNSQNSSDILDFAIKNVTHEPQNKWSYSYVNYTLLAGIVEILSHKPYEEYTQEKIISPLNLKHSFFYNTQSKEQTLIDTYSKDNNGKLSKNNIKKSAYINELGTGNLAMSAEDFLIFIQAVIDGTLLDSNEVIAMWTPNPTTFNYTYKSGFYHKDNYLYGHGLFHGYEPTVYISEDGSDAVIFFANMYQPDKLNTNLVQDIYQQIIAPYTGPTAQ
ncbi:hypothetical protein CBF34_05440 [Vagococcus penaei]|uniref:Uncharacterized protein n=1 Tax=Vagococcus penaei TaxID=633807 RepID=A0A1Q2D6G2_9ENTE|nr:serine hydrolase domain-containing protein [Vagococcus penaei]AQP53871.1 hypothetical protein BW732_06345 [Vagococcus penaei]RSU02965.1 hypothetical protein CBF34_05440 [Vagococcus penaei]